MFKIVLCAAESGSHLQDFIVFLKVGYELTKLLLFFSFQNVGTN